MTDAAVAVPDAAITDVNAAIPDMSKAPDEDTDDVVTNVVADEDPVGRTLRQCKGNTSSTTKYIFEDDDSAADPTYKQPEGKALPTAAPEEPLPAKAVEAPTPTPPVPLEEPLLAKAVEAPTPTPPVAVDAPEEKRKADDMRMDPNNIPGERITRGKRVPLAGLESLLFINMQYK